MKAILEFNLPEEREEFEIHNSSSDFYLAISDHLDAMRNIIKYKELLNNDEAELFDKLKDDVPEFRDCFDSYSYDKVIENFSKIIAIPKLTDEQRNVLLKLHANYNKHEQTEELRKGLFIILDDRGVHKFF